MADRLSPEARSAHMRRIRKADTTPERMVRRMAHALGFRFRLHRRDLPGTPDLVFPRLRKAILVHGCFWHQHPGCRLARMPKTRLEYWIPKLRRNQERDAVAAEALRMLGWDVLVLWECEVAADAAVATTIATFLNGTSIGSNGHE
jgi:DNA mismatch endonuclease, patch repair protein